MVSWVMNYRKDLIGAMQSVFDYTQGLDQQA
ncbi:hypothetical protein HRbin04_00960 [archaeon HR04]|nr:hypothetical protein HRbin04_00960 [archaeon HR04]